MLISDILAANAHDWPDRTALVLEGQGTTFAELHTNSRHAAAALAPLVSHGNHVAIIATASRAYVELMYGCPAAGVVLAMVNYRLNPKEWVWILNNAEARILFIEEQFLAQLAPLLTSLETVKKVIVLDGRGADSYVGFRDSAPAEATATPTRPDDPAFLIYTSGTTGFPKGAIITHANVIAGATAMALENAYPFGMRMLLCFPLCHASGFMVFAGHLRAAEVLLVRGFSAPETLALIKRHRVTHLSIAPTMLSFVFDEPAWPACDLSSIRLLQYGGMPMPTDMARTLDARGIRLSTGWGQTESTSTVTHLGPEEHKLALAGDESVLQSCGRPHTFSAVGIFDETMHPAPAGEIGEMCIRGPLVMDRYWDNEVGTAAAFEGGWLHTGDMARMDDQGRIYIVERKKDVIKSGGQNIYSREVERVLMTHEAVREVAIIGIPDPVWGESVVAVVVRKPDMTVTAEMLIALCVSQLASYKKPKRVVFLDSLPKNVTGKIAKNTLREMIAEQLATASPVN